MKKIGLLIIIVLSILESYGQQKNFIDQPYIETTAMVDSLVVPDRIYLSILITEKDTKGKISVEELENKMNTKLTGLGINTTKELTLSDVASNFKKYFLKKTEVLKNKAYTLLVYNAETAGKVISELEAINISNVYLNKTEYSKLEELKIELKAKSVLKAKKQAESMLKPLQLKLGKTLYISDINSNNPNTFNGVPGVISGLQIRGYGTFKSREDKTTNIEFDKIKIQSAVSIKFGIE